MAVTVDHLSLPDALELGWLPWKRLTSEHQAMPTMEPGWWQAYACCRGARIDGHQLVCVQQAGRWLAASILRCQRPLANRTPSQHFSLDLSLPTGVGLAGVQPTAFFQGLARDWSSRQRGVAVLEWALDQTDASWNQRWHTALECCELRPPAVKRLLSGWLLERAAAPVSSLPETPGNETNAWAEERLWAEQCLWADGNPGESAGVAVQYLDPGPRGMLGSGWWPLADWLPLLEYTAERSAFRWYTAGKGHWIGLMDCQTQRRLAGDWVDCHGGTWRPWCVLGRGELRLDWPFWQQFLASIPAVRLPRLVLPRALVRSDTSVWLRSSGLAEDPPGTRNAAPVSAAPLWSFRGQLGGSFWPRLAWPRLPRFLARH